jgi:hypothetical protein
MFSRQLMSSPDYYPLGIDYPRGVVWFTRMSREDYRLASFVDFYARRQGRPLYAAKIDDLLACNVEPIAARARGPICYVLHYAFCCSTLLCRYLEELPSFLVMKEPTFLSQAAMGFRPPYVILNHSNGSMSHQWTQMLNLCIAFLGRRYSAHDVVVVKATDLCYLIGESLLSADSQSKMVLLSVDLKTFMLSILKSHQRREWLRRRVLTILHIDPTQQNAYDKIGEASDAHGAAWLWAYYTRLRDRIKMVAGKRAICISAGQIADQPIEAVERLLRFLEVEYAEQETTKMFAASLVPTRHSKDRSRFYDANSRRSELALLEDRLRAEVDSGLEWASRHFAITE